MNWFKSVVGLGVLAALAVLGWQARETRREVTALAARLDAPPAVAPAAPVALPPAVAPRLPGEYLLEAADVVELSFPVGADQDVVALFGGKKFVVAPDGTIGLEPLGRLTVAGATVTRAERLVQELLGMAAVSLKVSSVTDQLFSVIDVSPSNTKGATRLLNRSVTVFDVLAAANLSAETRCNVWVQRNTPGKGVQVVLPVDYRGITQSGRTGTNYQILPDDQVFIHRLN